MGIHGTAVAEQLGVDLRPSLGCAGLGLEDHKGGPFPEDSALSAGVEGPAAAHLSLARCLRALGDPEAAIDEYERALVLVPAWPIALEELAALTRQRSGD